MSTTDRLNPDDYRYRIDTPEQIALSYDVAGIGSRAIAALADLFILGLGLLLVGCAGGFLIAAAGLLGESTTGDGNTVAILIFALLFLLISASFSGYYIFFEAFWQGQTPGKRWAKLRVIKAGGYPITFLDSAIRNLVRLVDFLPAYYALGMAVMLVDRRSRRLGDLAAGTLVVKERQAQMTTQLEPPMPAFELRPQAPTGTGAIPHLGRLTSADHSVLRNYLSRRSTLAPDAVARLDMQMALRFAGKLEHRLQGEAAAAFLSRLDRQINQQELVRQ